MAVHSLLERSMGGKDCLSNSPWLDSVHRGVRATGKGELAWDLFLQPLSVIAGVQWLQRDTLSA